MNAINRQKFLAELGKLLTFMYEEDRLYALNMYERMFDIAGDNEQWLIQNLMSPTRQAVIIARAYNAKERKLSVSAQWKEEDGYEDESGETPAFVLAINQIFDDLFPEDEETAGTGNAQNMPGGSEAAGETEPKRYKMPRAAVLLNQTQEFTSVPSAAAEEGLPEEEMGTEWLEELYARETERAETETEPDPRVSVIDRAESFDSQHPPAAEQEKDAEPDSLAPQEDRNPETQEQTEPEAVPGAEETVGEGQEGIPALTDQKKKRRSIESLLGFRKEKASAAAAEEKPAQLQPDLPTEQEEPKEKPRTEEDLTAAESLREPEQNGTEHTAPRAVTEVQTDRTEPSQEPVNEELPVIPKPVLRRDAEEAQTAERVLNVPLLIIFLIVAIPSTAVVLAVLALPTALFLSLSFGAMALGSVLIVSAFSGFAVFADILLLLGAAIISLALGLLFLWTAFWLIGEAMVGWIRSVGRVRQEWCYKEVPTK